jgi:hypothetical protein
MIDVRTMFTALKAKWVQRIYNADPHSSNWVQLALFYIERVCKFNILTTASFDIDMVMNELDVLPVFYKEMIYAYGYMNKKTCNDFSDNLYSEFLWANKFVYFNHGEIKHPFIFKNWSKCGINRIGDLRFINGTLDTNDIFRRVIYRTNIYAEILIVREALSRYTRELKDKTCPHVYNMTNEISFLSTKDAYRHLLDCFNRVSCHEMSVTVAELCEENEFEVKQSFRKQLCNKLENKMIEFNFKIIHGTLPCNANLKRWRIIESDQCDLCNSEQTIEHLLFSCKRPSFVWKLFSQVYHKNITFKTIVCGHEDKDISHVVTIIAFILYKEWLLCSLRSKKRKGDFPISLYVHELQLRQKVYEVNDLYIYLNPIINHMQSVIVR